MNRPEDVAEAMMALREYSDEVADWAPELTITEAQDRQDDIRKTLDYITTLEGALERLAFEGGLDATTRAEAAEAKVAILRDALDYGLCLYGARDGTWPVHQRKEFTRRANAAMDATAPARAALQGGQG
jgi:hypothetical protein